MYSEPTVSTTSDIALAISVAAAAAGWTVHRDAETSAGNRTVTIKHADTDYIHIRAQTDGNVYIRQSVGYDGGAAWNAQPNQASVYQSVNTGNGPYTKAYAFGGTTPAVHLYFVVQVSAGMYRHFAFGCVQKHGAFTGGSFADGTYGDTGINGDSLSYHHSLFGSHQILQSSTTLRGSLRMDYDGNTNYFAPFSTNEAFFPFRAGGGQYAAALLAQYYARSGNPFSATTPMCPFNLYVRRSGGFFSIIGRPANIRFMNIARFTPDDEFSIGLDTWKCFPFFRKGTVANALCSYNYGYAYKKVV